MSRLFRRTESRAISYQDVWGTGGNPSTVFGTGFEAALRVVPVYAATSLIADLISTLPFRAFRDVGNGQRRPLDVQPALVTDPAPFGGRVAWLHQCLASMLLRGNATGVILTRDGVTPTKIAWQHPDWVSIDESRTIPVFRVNGREIPLLDIVHIPAYVLPGSIQGLAPIQLHRMHIQSSLRAQEFGLAWYENGVAPSAHLKNTRKELPQDQADKLKKRFMTTVRNGEPWVTGSDWEYDGLSLTPADAMFLEQIKATASQIASIFRVAPEDVGGEAAGSLTYQTLEQNELKLARRALLPWTTRIEQALNGFLPKGQYVKFNLDAVSRADLKTRMESHEVALRIGVETLDEARALEERPPLSDAEIKKWQSLYWQRTGAAAGTTPTGRMEQT